MRNIKKIGCIAVFSLIYSCATSREKKVESEWSELERAGAISCSLWPIQQNEIDVTDIMATRLANGGIVATVRKRDGSSVPTFIESRGSAVLDVDKMRAFPIGRNAVVVGVSEWKKQPIAIVVQNKNNHGWIEVRGVRDNRMISRMSTPLNDEVSSGKIVETAKGWWMQLQHSESVSSFVRIAATNDTNWQFTLANFQAKTRFATLVSSKASGKTFVVEQAPHKDQEFAKFVLTGIEADGKSTDAGHVLLPVTGGLESWSTIALKDRVMIALVRGDSMIGQGVLAVSAVTVGQSGANVEWKKEFSYPDVHLGEAVWIANDQEALLGIIKWIDAEGSLSRVKVDANSAGSLTDVGVFPKGTAFAAGYLQDNASGLGIFRFREKELWKYKLCRLAL